MYFFVAAFIFVIALFGTKLVRKAASTLSVCILVGLLLVLLPNILVQFPTIIYNISLMAGGQVSVLASKTPSFLGALWMAILYFFFQLPSVSVMYQHMEDVRSVKEINRAVILIFVCNFFAMELSIFGLLAVAFVPALKDASVPMLVMVQKWGWFLASNANYFYFDYLGFDFDSCKYDFRHRYPLCKSNGTW